jgi:L-seryl-tRNA(Ser) seleniumtransferase
MALKSEKSASPGVQDPANHGELYRMLPSVNDVLLTPAFLSPAEVYPRRRLLSATRATLAVIRREIADGRHNADSLSDRIAALPDEITNELKSREQYSLRPVINATGVLLHTNLGRAPLSHAALDHIAEVAQDYCNLELDLDTGARSRRDVHTESLMLRALGVSDSGQYGVVIVNNCAAATFLALNSLAEKQEVIVSRGELVEIGGGFRIPEILEKSGATLKEVGTTNRTRLADYERALSAATALILRVHQSNFSIEGFAERSALADLVALSRRTGVPLFEDQGTGLLSSLENYGIRGEPSLRESFEQGVDLIAASGDKLLGGPQCGLLVGLTGLVEKVQKNPLLRAFRVDKLTYAALEATLLDHLSGRPESLPLFRMLSIPPEEIMRRCRQIADQINSLQLAIDVVPVDSLVGGGTAPKATLASCAISLHHSSLSAEALASALRHLDPPIIGRISENAVLLDLRTVNPDADAAIGSSLNRL